MGLKPGDLLIVAAEDDWLFITPPEKYAQKTRGLLKGMWGNTPDQVEAYLEAERNSWKS